MQLCRSMRRIYCAEYGGIFAIDVPKMEQKISKTPFEGTDQIVSILYFPKYQSRMTKLI